MVCVCVYMYMGMYVYTCVLLLEANSPLLVPSVAYGQGIHNLARFLEEEAEEKTNALSEYMVDLYTALWAVIGRSAIFFRHHWIPSVPSFCFYSVRILASFLFFACMYVCVYIYIYMYMDVCVCVCSCAANITMKKERHGLFCVFVKQAGNV